MVRNIHEVRLQIGQYNTKLGNVKLSPWSAEERGKFSTNEQALSQADQTIKDNFDFDL